jgi:hypothetical protein
MFWVCYPQALEIIWHVACQFRLDFLTECDGMVLSFVTRHLTKRVEMVCLS